MQELLLGGKHVYIHTVGITEETGDGSLSPDAPMPLVLHMSHRGDGSEIVEELLKEDLPPFYLAAVSDINWDDEMTPWAIPPIAKDDTPCSGGADAFIKTLENEILPGILRALPAKPAYTAVAGYSLGGLFATYAFYTTDIFDRGVSASGSLWFPDFLDFVKTHDWKRKPDAFYFSLGDKESHTRNAFLKPVEENTGIIAAYYKEMGVPSTFVLNPGNHFTDGAGRTARGIAWVLRAEV